MRKISVKLLIALALLTFVSSVSAQRSKRVDQLLNKLKPGEWVGVEGIAQKNFSIIVSEIKMVYGEVEEDDWEISGKISSINPKDKTFYLLNVKVVLDENMEYDDDFDLIKSFKDLTPGLFVEIEGAYLPNGTFHATEIGQVNEKARKLNRLDWTGKVDEVIPGSRTITMLGHTLILTDETQVKNLIQD